MLHMNDARLWRAEFAHKQAAGGSGSGALGGGAAWFSWPGVVAVAAASTALLHVLLDRLPRCFTLGAELQAHGSLYCICALCSAHTPCMSLHGIGRLNASIRRG